MQNMEGILGASKRLGQLVTVRVADVRVNPHQPRRRFDENQLMALAQSIRENGLIMPLTVRLAGDGKYELIAGERRLKALKILRAPLADAYLISADDLKSRMLALIENIQRESLHYLEEAAAFRAILLDSGMTQEALAAKIGKSPSAVANRLRLLRLSPRVRARLFASPLSERHARALLSLRDEDSQLTVIEEACAGNLSVRQTEALVARISRQPAAPKAAPVMRLFVRDKRMFVNTVLGAVKQLNRAGLPAISRVEEKDGVVEVVVTLPSLQSGPPEIKDG